MKKITLFFSMFLIGSAAFAQDGYYIKGGLGAGISGSSFSVFAGDAYKNNMDIFSGQSQFTVGYTHGRLQFETGMSYLKTGVSFIAEYGYPTCGVAEPSGTPAPAPVPDPVKYTITNSHLVIPFSVSYTIISMGRFSISPGIGLEAFLNITDKLSTSADIDPSFLTVIGYSYNNISAAMLLKCDLQYNITRKFAVWCSPSYQNMLTSLTTKVAGDAMSRNYDRAFLFNAGVKFNLPDTHKLSAMGK